MKEYKIGDIVGLDEYTDAALWCRKNNAYLKDIYDVNGARKFEIKEIEEPEPHIPTREEISALREQAYIKEVDILHAQKDRKTILGTWTEEDEANYIAEVKLRSEDIANRYPYPTEE